jgi:hypothetical protein
MSEDPVPRPPDLAAIRARRESLRRATVRVQALITRTAQERSATWVGEVAAAAGGLAQAWETHVLLTESRDGILEQIVDEAPRLSSTADRLRREHDQVTARLRTAIGDLDSVDGSGVQRAGAGLAQVLATIAHHRRAGGELIYQAYQVDLGGE